MRILTIDFETYYDPLYSLSKMTTEEYIRDPRFEIIGVSVKEDDGETRWYSGPLTDTALWLRQYPWEECLALAHNAPFDGAILNWRCGMRPKGWLDTLSMARALHGTEVGGSLKVMAEFYQLGVKGDEVVAALGKHREDFTPEAMQAYSQYCCNDTNLTYDLFKAMANEFPAGELRLIDLTVRMFTEPVLSLDTTVLKEHLQKVQEKKADLMAALDGVGRDKLMSNEMLAGLLSDLGVEPPRKISPTTKKETWAFAKNDEGFKALLEHEDPRVQAIVAARLGVKSTLEETRTERFINIARRGSMPVPLRYYAAHTGRWGGDDKINLQNLPRTSPLKKAICAPIDYCVLDSDSSQIEARTLAWLASQDDLVATFEENNKEIAAGVPKADHKFDPYKIMASAIYGKPVADILEFPERFVGKQTILGSGYGMGGKKFRVQLKGFKVDLPEEECNRIIQTYRLTYPMIPMLWKEGQRILDAILMDQYTEFGRDNILKVEGKRGIRLPNGLYLKYPNLRKAVNDEGKTEYVYDTKRGKAMIATRIYGPKVIENVCQALARIIIGWQMLLIAKKYRPIMTVHDAIGTVVPKNEVERAKDYVEMCMRLRPDWCLDLPLNCESGHGVTYGDC